MGFLRRLLGGSERGNEATEPTAAADPSADPSADLTTVDDDERARELELARFEQERTDDLGRRQQRFADRSWRPPPQGSERRADDEDSTER